VFSHRGGSSINGDFTISVPPQLSVRAFLSAVAKDPKNKQHSLESLRPHDPSHLGRRNQDHHVIPSNPGAKPNCTFDVSDLSKSIKDAGLMNGAVLEQPENNMRD
jgi:hypothetical protein